MQKLHYFKINRPSISTRGIRIPCLAVYPFQEGIIMNCEIVVLVGLMADDVRKNGSTPVLTD